MEVKFIEKEKNYEIKAGDLFNEFGKWYVLLKNEEGFTFVDLSGEEILVDLVSYTLDDIKNDIQTGQLKHYPSEIFEITLMAKLG